MNRILAIVITLTLASSAFSAQTPVTQITDTMSSVGALKGATNTRLSVIEANRQDHENRIASMETGKANASAFASQAAFMAAWGWTPGGGSFDQAGNYTLTGSWDFTGATVTGVSGGSMVYPGAGISVSTGTAWGSSVTPGTGVAAALAAAVDGTGGLASKASLDALPNIVFGTGLTLAEDTPSAGTDTVSVTANTYQAYDANMIAWPSTISAAEVGYLNGLTEALSTSLAGKQTADAQLDTWAGVSPGTGVTTAIAADIGAVGGLRRIVAKGPSSLATSAIPANTCSLQPFEAANVVAATDKPEAWISGRLSTVSGFGVTSAGSLRIDVFLTDGYINFDVCNNTSASITPGAITIQWDVTR